MEEKPTPQCTLGEMLSDIKSGSDAIYDGPGAYTEVELKKQSPFSGETVRQRAEDKVAGGEWVRVTVQRVARSGRAYYPAAWVKKDIYDEWKGERGDTRKLEGKTDV